MTTSFAAFASQYLTGRQNVAESRTSDAQPMFFSFASYDSRGGLSETDLDDSQDPHFRENNHSSRTHHAGQEQEEDEDPYLRLDEDEHIARSGFNSRAHNQQSVPLIASERGYESDDMPRGWLAHQPSPMRYSRSPSPTPSSSSESEPSPSLIAHGATRKQHTPAAPPSTQRDHISFSLTESLLPRDGQTRPLDVFSLPDPRHTSRGHRRHNDSMWTAIWCAGVSFCFLFCILLLFITHKPKQPISALPYTTLLHTVPMLTILTFTSAIAAYIHIFLLRLFARPVMLVTSVFIPATLFISAIWSFVGSFMWDGDKEPTWGETVGLRLFSLVPLALALLTARRLVDLPRLLHTTSATLTLSTNLLVNNPFLLALSPGILLASLILSIPFLTLIFRLLLVGYATKPTNESSIIEWHVHGWANWSIAGTVAVWLWSWGVSRGILRMTCSSVIGAWYFANPDLQPPPPMSTHTIHAALTRSTGPSLGSVVLGALILTAIRLLLLLAMVFDRLPLYLPARAFFLIPTLRMAVGWIERVTTALSQYALIYVGLTGDPFMPSAKRARVLTSQVENKVERMVRKKANNDAPLTMLTVAPLTLTFPFALMTYLFVAHTLDAPQQALGAAMLAASVTGLVGLFCVGLVRDTVDTLYLCYCIDKETGENRRPEVSQAFEYNSSHNQAQPADPNNPRPLPQMTYPAQRNQQQQPSTTKRSNGNQPQQHMDQQALLSQAQAQAQRALSQVARVLPIEQKPPKPQVGPTNADGAPSVGSQRMPLAGKAGGSRKGKGKDMHRVDEDEDGYDVDLEHGGGGGQHGSADKEEEEDLMNADLDPFMGHTIVQQQIDTTHASSPPRHATQQDQHLFSPFRNGNNNNGPTAVSATSPIPIKVRAQSTLVQPPLPQNVHVKSKDSVLDSDSESESEDGYGGLGRLGGMGGMGSGLSAFGGAGGGYGLGSGVFGGGSQAPGAGDGEEGEGEGEYYPGSGLFGSQTR